ncbi:MAG: UDP-N-acetylmuramate--L-alanine ligase [Candidatus Omnitrophica bacterium]|nr:UDP-N-acetylmuramate--L-alanine ligase [Candidatus Omnitrophota bacterium]
MQARGPLIRGNKIHFIGMGGVGMSALADLLLARGCQISGSDLKTNKITLRLEAKGAEVYLGHLAKNIDDPDLVIYSSCIKDNNPEILEAKRKCVPVIHRAALLGMLMDEKCAIAIAGTHGKTTTTSMISLVLKTGKLDPSFAIGADVDVLGGNAFAGEGKYFVAEADESDGSLLEFNPYYAIITNIDREHLDYYDDLDHIVRTFEKFIGNIHKSGTLFCCCEDVNIQKAIKSYKGSLITYGFNSDADVRAENVRLLGMRSVFVCIYKGKSIGEFTLNIPGRHNVLNALAAICMGMEAAIETSYIKNALALFTGADRRFQIKNSYSNIMIVDDYAHHPTEIKATLQAARGWEKRVVGVFQPHRYSRTKFLQKEFGRCFANADDVVITDIYAANEAPLDGVGARAIYEEVKQSGHKSVCFLPLGEVKDYLLETLRDGDMLLMLGAGDIGKLAEELNQQLPAAEKLTSK